MILRYNTTFSLLYFPREYKWLLMALMGKKSLNQISLQNSFLRREFQIFSRSPFFFFVNASRNADDFRWKNNNCTEILNNFPLPNKWTTYIYIPPKISTLINTNDGITRGKQILLKISFPEYELASFLLKHLKFPFFSNFL